MRRVYALSFLFLDVAVGQGAGAAIAGCVNDCLRSTTVGCDSGDIGCLCSTAKRKEFIAELSSCIKKGCNPDEVVPAEDLYGPLCDGAGEAKEDSKGPVPTTQDANAPIGGGGQEESTAESSTTSKGEANKAMPTEEVMSTDDAATSTSGEPVKAGTATAVVSVSTGRAVSEATASSGTTSSTTSSILTEEAQATDTEESANDMLPHGGGLSAGAKAGIGVGIALGVVGLGSLVAAIWLIKRRRATTGATGLEARHAHSVKSPNPFARQVEVAEIDGRPAPQELPA